MKRASELDYTTHHMCIYDKDPRDHMWSFLKWHHGITGYFGGDSYHITDEGHADYTFLGCGGRAFQLQLEAPPYQFRYEQEWYGRHGNGYNHVCWIVNDARASYEQLQASGATVMQEFQPFPTYAGFVMADPEGRWVEVMEYTDPVLRIPEFTRQPSGPCGLEMLGFVAVVKDLDRMVDWYRGALNMHVVAQAREDAHGVVYLSDARHHPEERNTLMVLTTARAEEDRRGFETHGPHLGALLYRALDFDGAHRDAVGAGLQAIDEPRVDALTRRKTARLREPSGNQIVLESIAPEA